MATELDDLQAQIEMLEKQNEQLALENAELELRLADAAGTVLEISAPKVPTIPTELVTVGKKKYKWLVPVFHLHGMRVTAEEATTEVIAALLEVEGQGILSEVK